MPGKALFEGNLKEKSPGMILQGTFFVFFLPSIKKGCMGYFTVKIRLGILSLSFKNDRMKGQVKR